METQAGPNEDSSNDENYDEAEKDDSTEEPHDFSDSFKPLITKVWKMVNMFCRSPVKNDALQKYVKIIHEKELQVIVSKCRWNSLLAMLKHFNLLKKEIQKALLDISQMELYKSVKEENALKDLKDVLES